MDILDELKHERDELWHRARVKHWRACLERGKWSGFRSFSELFELVVTAERSDIDKLRAEQELRPLRDYYYGKLAKELEDALSLSSEFLPQHRKVLLAGWKLWWAKSIIRHAYLKALLEMDDAPHRHSEESKALQRAVHRTKNVFQDEGFADVLEELRRELPELRR
jgi:hypothetical protein